MILTMFASGLKLPSLIRVGRLAVVEEAILVGSVGQIDSHRLERIKGRLARWLIDA
jgi:mRNA interferase MazF